MRMYFALLALLPAFVVGCTVVTKPASDPEIFDFPRAEEPGPADYAYARARNDYDESQITRGQIEWMEKAISLNEARCRLYDEMAAKVRVTMGPRPDAAKQSLYETYMSEAFLLKEEIRRQRTGLAMLKSNYGLMLGKMRRDTLQGREIEAGGIPLPSY